MPEIIIRATARREIKEYGKYLDEKAERAVTEQFLAALQESFEALAYMPRMGPLCGFRRSALRRLRRWPVKDFENWLIFYLARRNGVEIVHVMHGARDIVSLLDD
ncbi:MAG: type II toxin-antitoxin system RelE/ParE family toxin [Chloroflexi bacterium]|nr:type II toxin-antitoxin system RelE/ParE family toxin [Chloroflexota bacterium]